MKHDGIKLNMDCSDIVFINGSAKSISSGKDDAFVTKIDMILPFNPQEIESKRYEVEYKENKIEVFIKIVGSKELDPIYIAIKDDKIGTPNESGLPELFPLEVFTDNRGVYPAVFASIIFPYRLATWIDDNHPTGIKMDYDYEVMQVTGGPDNNEKIQALLIINRLIDSIGAKSIQKLKYDDITVFTETYFKKGISAPVLHKQNALTSKTAYKDAIQAYYLKGFDNHEIKGTVQRIHEIFSLIEIKTEKDLYDIVSKTIEDVLKHHIDTRRWIESFWDGERKIHLDGQEFIVPQSPKNEIKIQPTLHVILDMALTPIGIHVVRECNEGVGLLDFKFLYTTNDKIPLAVGVEFKVAHHKKIKKGIAKQLPAYLKSIRSEHGIFVVMWFKDSKYFREPQNREKEQMSIWLKEEAISISAELDLTISAWLIDASIRPSASNL